MNGTMKIVAISPRLLCALAAFSVPVSASYAAQPSDSPDAGVTGSVTDTTMPPASEMTKGPEVEGVISALNDNRLQITADDGSKSVVTITETTKITSSGGFLSLGRDKLGGNALLNGLPVTVKTLRYGSSLVASQVDLKSKDLKTAKMIHSGTDQRFAEQTAATDALRSRMGDIDKYNVKSTTNVYFDTGKTVLSPKAKADLCAAASSADAMDNALLLVVGYTDSTGSEDVNQALSEKRAARVVNYLQQACRWKPYRMLTPTGMAESDPTADNNTAEGRAQNRRVSVNVLVSKSVDGF